MTGPIDITGNLYISTIADDAAGLARENGLGLEIAEFCTAFNMDADFETWDNNVKLQMRGIDRFIFHAPFNELYPSAIDPQIVEVAKRRFAQAFALMRGYGIRNMVVHSGFMPILYTKDWFKDKSIAFWKEFLSDKPDGFRLFIENVFEETPDVLCDIVRAVDDSRLRLCFDTGHAAIFSKEISITDWAERAAPFIGHVHLHNNNGSIDTHDPPGIGVIDIVGLIRTITKEAPDATVTIETINGRQSIQWLKSEGFLY